MIKKEYTNGETTVIWQPDLCIHSGVCFRSLPEVFRPRERPWVRMDQSTTAKIVETVHACPSGALSIKRSPPPSLLTIEPKDVPNKVTVIQNGPVKVLGSCTVTLADGTKQEKPNGVSLCRCGKSTTRPFCDGSHKSNGFTG